MKYLLGEVDRIGDRPTNQDRFAAIETDEGVLMVLADGMGGHPFGEVAAEYLVETARRIYGASKRPVDSPSKLFTAIVQIAHRAILNFSRTRCPNELPGSTLVLCLIQDAMAYWVHLGDSRFYLLQGGLATYRSIDHTYVEELYQRQQISFQERQHHPLRNRITQCVGCFVDAPHLPTIGRVKLNTGDVVVLCSDGFWGGIDDALLGEKLVDGDLHETLASLASTAEKGGYPRSDNISAVALRVLDLHSNKAREVGRNEQPQGESQGSQPEELQQAIEQIETVMEEYEAELKK